MDLTWTDGGWTYSLAEEGHLFRFAGTFPRGEDEPVRADFGLIPGGAFVAIERLVQARPARRKLWTTDGRPWQPEGCWVPDDALMRCDGCGWSGALGQLVPDTCGCPSCAAADTVRIA